MHGTMNVKFINAKGGLHVWETKPVSCPAGKRNWFIGCYIVSVYWTLCNPGFSNEISQFFSHILFIYSVHFWKQTINVSLCLIHWLVFPIETYCVSCEVRIGIYSRTGHRWHMAYAHCMLDTKATNTQSEYAFLLQQWLHERASMLLYTYIACLFYRYFKVYTHYFKTPKSVLQMSLPFHSLASSLYYYYYWYLKIKN